MSEFGDNIKLWAGPRKWSIVGGISPIFAALVLLGLLTGRWLPSLGGVVGLIIAGSGVAMFVGRPELWKSPKRRWRSLTWWVLAWTSIVVGVVCLVLILT